MLRALIHRSQSMILARPRLVLAASAGMVLLALLLARGVEFRTSRSELASPDDPDQQRLDRLVGEFRGSQALVACLEALPDAGHGREELRRVADELAEEFDRDPAVAQVFHRVEQDWLLEHGLYLVPAGMLDSVVQAARQESERIESLPDLTGLEDLNRLIAGRIEFGFERPSAIPAPEAGEGIRRLARLLAAERRFLEDPTRFVAQLEAASPLMLLAGTGAETVRDGYLQSRDGSVLFLVVTPRDQDDSLPVLRALVGAVRRRADQVLAREPGFRVVFTGPAAMTVEEMDAVRRDTWFTSLVALVGVTVLTLLVFRWKSHALLVLAALGAGLAWAFGAVRLELGYLNLVTSSFISTLIGVGVAYGIHPVSEYELEGAHTRDPLEAVRGAYHATGAAVTVAAVTTSVAFFSILLMRFRGFAELGLVAGLGVLLCLFASLVTLPALLVVYGRWRRRRGPEPSKGAVGAAVDRLWVERAAGRICGFPRLTTLAAVVLTAAAAWAAWGVGFNTNILDLLPEDAESLRHLQQMTAGSDLSPVFNMVVAGDLATLADLRQRAETEPAIERFDSILHFLPDDPEASHRVVRALSGLLDRIELPTRTRRPERQGIVDSLQRLEVLLDEAAEDAFGAGLAELLQPLEEARAEAQAAWRAAEGTPEGIEVAWDEGQRALLDWCRRLLVQLRRAVAAEPPTLQSLPDSLRERFVTDTGRFIGFLYPVGSVFDPEALEDYIAASRRVSAETTGFPLMFYLMSGRITSGFYWAVAAGAVLVLLILLLDYRSLRDATLTVIPLAMGVVWMMGAMRLGGLDFNFANLVGVPLIIGVGIDNGVHVVHRIRLEGSEGMSVVLRHTGRAVLISSLTTMIGFGSLALASHRGLASLGMVLLLGVGSCLLTSTIVLPNLLVVLGVVKK